MSAISTILTRLRAAIWAIDVRDDIANAIEQCYSDVSNPTLRTEALEAALQNKIDEGEMAALTIGDHTITAAKLAQGVIDNTLATSGAAADAKKTGDEITAIKADLESKGLTDTVKVALFDAISHIGIWTDEHGQDYIDALEAVLFPPEGLVSISAVYTQSGTVYTTAPIDSLKENLVVTATYEDESTATIPASAYTLSGALTAGTSTITVTYGGETATFNVTVTAPWTYEWNYSDGLPENNGMAKVVTGNSSTSLTTDGVLMEAEDVSGKYAQYYYAAADQSTVFTSGVYEFIFEINSFGSYNRAPYGNGVKVYLGMGQRNGNPAKCAELTFNESGVLHLVESGGSSTWETIDSTAFVTGREYSIRCEQNLTEMKVYVDGTLVATIPASTNYETVTSQAFIAYRGISVVLKRFRFRLGA